MPDSAEREPFQPAVTFHAVEGGGVLFNAATGKVFACNPAAALSWLSLAAGEDDHAAAVSLADTLAIEPHEAERWFGESRAAFEDLQLLPHLAAVPRVNPPPGEGHAVTRLLQGELFELFDRVFAVQAPPAVFRQIGALLRACRPAKPPSEPPSGPLQVEVVARGERWGVLLNGADTAEGDLDEVAGLIERHVIQEIVPAVPHTLCLHAAGLDNGQKRLVLAGPSGAGKTTLSVALSRAGWGLGSDELLLIGEAKSMRALPIPPCIKAEAHGLIGMWYPGLGDEPMQKRYGRAVKYLPLGGASLPSTDTIVVFPRFNSAGRPEARAIPPFEGLSNLLTHCLYVPQGFQQEQLDQLLCWHKGTRYWQLTYGSTEDALRMIEEIDHA